MPNNTVLPDSIAHLNLASRERIEQILDNLRDDGYALASLCLSAHRAVHMNHADAVSLLAVVMGRALEQAQKAKAIAQLMYL